MYFSGPLDARKMVIKSTRKFLWLIPYSINVSEWYVLAPFDFYFDDNHPERFIHVEAGWDTDLASVPGFFGFVIQKDGDFAQSAVTHDWCYKNRGDVLYANKPDGSVEKLPPLSRNEQDWAFYNGMKVLGTPPPIRVIMWRAVRNFGWISYQKKEGE